MDAGGADFDKAQRRMEGIRSGVWRHLVDLAYDPVVSGADGTFSLAAVPTAFGSVGVSATATIDGKPAHRVSDAVAAVPGGVTNVGVVRLADLV